MNYGSCILFTALSQLSVIFNFLDAMGHHKTMMEKYIYSTICSWVQPDVAITVWLLKADKSAIAEKWNWTLIGPNPNKKPVTKAVGGVFIIICPLVCLFFLSVCQAKLPRHGWWKLVERRSSEALSEHPFSSELLRNLQNFTESSWNKSRCHDLAMWQVRQNSH